ncbi:Alcohol dehydrogenase superfamily, zinc-type [Penicillium roqueforti FM164]|jgi:hypothetical protein|uniref:Alcohol dehydrogenase superfamily, zinc-containing n=2 Tax=Penicillium TaxID=5073 RepID=A0A0G4PZ70_PENC3|nr:Alcohol dehydrogenase superfamily, zinc-type [Penicillium roqueforti FM164]CRL31450.1 Alcohol dehydrogenase superfamily, zinc-containing [Penicillium camemberti]
MTGLYHLTTQNIEAAGARTIITSSSDEKVQYLKAQYDAYYIINYKTTPPGQLRLKRSSMDRASTLSWRVARELSNSPLMLLLSVVWFGFNHRIHFCCKARGGPGVADLALAKGAVVRGITRLKGANGGCD